MTADAKFWDRNARKYAKSKIKNMTAYEATLERVKARLKPTDHVLEIGCGTGSTALLLADNVESYTGADISPGMIEIAREKLAKAPVDALAFTVAPVGETRFESGSYDAILGFNLLHLVEDSDGAASRAFALLKPGGLYITKTPCLREMSVFIRILVPVMQLFRFAPFVAFLTRLDLEQMMRRAGFQIEEVRNFEGAPSSWYVVARKP